MRSNPGGKGVNVASALADNGHDVAVTGFLGRGEAGAFEELSARRKSPITFVRIAGQTRIGIKITDPVRGETTDINFPGAAPERSRRHDASLAGRRRSRRNGLSSPAASRRESTREFIATSSATCGGGGAGCCSTPAANRSRSRCEAERTIKPNIHEFEEYIGRRLPNAEVVVAPRAN